jgi:hypothetical protein
MRRKSHAASYPARPGFFPSRDDFVGIVRATPGQRSVSVEPTTPTCATSSPSAQALSGAGSQPRVSRTYRYVGLDWSDAEMRRAYDREQQRRWRAANKVAKRARS